MSSVNEWPMVKLGDIQRKVSSINPAKSPDQEFSLYSIPAYDAGTPEKALGSAIKSNKIELQPGDTLLSKIIPHIRRSWIVDEHETSSIGSSEWIVYQDDRLDPRFLRNFFLSDYFHAQFMQTVAGVGGSLNRARPAAVAQISIPIPPLPKQQRIAEILDTSLQLSEQIAIKITLLDEAEKSSYLSMFGAEPATTPTQELAASHKSSMRTGPFGSQLKHEEFVDEGVAVLGLDNVVSNRFRWAEPRHITAEKYEQLKRYTVYSGDVLISIMGTTGRCVIVPENIPTTINTKHICAITTDHARMFPEFLRASFLWHPEVRQALRQQTKGAIMAGLNMGIIKKLALPVPDISRQQEWISISKEFDTLREEILKQQSLAEELQNSFSTRTFTGQL